MATFPASPTPVPPPRRHAPTLVGVPELWQATIDALPLSVAVLDAHGTVRGTNTAWRAFAERNGGSPEATGVGASYLAACDAAPLDPVARDVAGAIRAIAAGGREEFEVEYPCHGPVEQRWYALQLRPACVRDARFVVVSHRQTRSRELADPPGQEERDQQLRGTQDFLQTLTRTMPDGMFVLDAEGRLLLMNPMAEHMLGWRSAELVGELMHEVTHCLREDGSPLALEDSAVRRAHETGAPQHVDSDVFLRRNGSLLPVSYSAASCEMPSGETGTVVVFSDISERKERERQLLGDVETLTQVAAIRDALDNDRFVLFAQPIVELATRKTVRHELLVRMRRADGSLAAPGTFLPAAEKTGLIREVDRHVVERGIRLAAAGHAVALNVSAASLSDPYLTSFVEERMRHHAADPALLAFEITETALVELEDAAQAFVARVSALGCEVALDDFGTGFGTFHYLKHLPAEVLKVDREFVRDLTTDPASAHVVRTIVRLAAGLGKRTVAEGVEDAATLDLLQELGVDAAQGYHLGRPAPVEDVLGGDS